MKCLRPARFSGLLKTSMTALALSSGAWPPKVPIVIEGPMNPPLWPSESEVPKIKFPVGEQLRFRAYWSWVPVAYAHVWTEWIQENGRWAIALRLRTRSAAVLNAVYPVDDFFETIVDPATLRPLRFVKKMNEGNNRYDEITQFDYESGTARWTSRLRNREKVLPIEPDARDIFSFLYWLRDREFEPGETVSYRVWADNKIYTVLPKPVAREVVNVPEFGPVPCTRFEPEAEFNGLFIRKGRVRVWVFDGEPRLAMRVDAEVPVASVRVYLTEVIDPAGSRWRPQPVPRPMSDRGLK